MNAARGRQLLLGVAALLLSAAWPSAALAHILSPDAAGIRQASTVEVDVAGDVIVGRPTDVTVRATNPAPDANQGSLTVSLPGNPTVEIVGASTAGAKIFKPGEPMYNFGSGQNAPNQVEAVELYVSAWPAGARHELRLRITSSAPYTLLARASLRRSNGSFLNLPANGPLDQQGAPTRQIDVAPRPVQPPTAAPAPPTAAPPPPATATPQPPTPTVAPPSATTAPAKPAAGQTQSPGGPPPPPQGPPATQPPAQPPTQAPAPTAAPTSSSGPSVPLLLAGLGIIAVGIAVGLLALALVLRRRSAPVAPPWAGPYPGAPYGMPGSTPYAGGGYGPPGTPPPPAAGPYGGGTPPWNPAGNQGGWQGGQTDRFRPPVPSNPWDRPPTPWDAQPQQDRPPSWPAGTPPPPPTRADQPPTEAAPRPAGTPHPVQGTSVEGMSGAGGVTPTGERYTQRVLVGRGGMGSVFRAYDSRLRRWVALKIMHADLGLRPGFLDRFIREAQMAAMLEHPNIVTVYDIEPQGDSIQMVMSWIDGEDLQHTLEREGALAPDRAARLLDQMAAALDHAHQRERPVLHRDIKPSNIMIGPHERVVLTDFGIARLIGDVSLTQTGQMVGTPAFMAPEVVQGAEADARADVYALGVVLYQMLTGRTPFRAETPLALLHAHVHTPPPPPRTVMPGLPPAVDQVMLRALAKEPSERFQSAGALARALRSAIGRA